MDTSCVTDVAAAGGDAASAAPAFPVTIAAPAVRLPAAMNRRLDSELIEYPSVRRDVELAPHRPTALRSAWMEKVRESLETYAERVGCHGIGRSVDVSGAKGLVARCPVRRRCRRRSSRSNPRQARTIGSADVTRNGNERWRGDGENCRSSRHVRTSCSAGDAPNWHRCARSRRSRCRWIFRSAGCRGGCTGRSWPGSDARAGRRWWWWWRRGTGMYRHSVFRVDAMT